MKAKVLSENTDFFGMPIFESEHAGHMDSGTALAKPKKVEEPIKADEKDLEKSKVKPKEIGNGEVKIVPVKGDGASDDQLDDLSKSAVKPGKVDSKPKEMSESDMEKLILMGPEAALGEKPEKEDQSSGKEHAEKEAAASIVKTADAGAEPKKVEGDGVKADSKDEKPVAAAAVKVTKAGADPKLMAERKRVNPDRKAIGESNIHPALQRKMMEESRAKTAQLIDEAKKKKMMKEGVLNAKSIETACMDILAQAEKLTGKEGEAIKASCMSIMKQVEKHQKQK